MTYEDYLQEKHAKNYTGTDDDMPDNFDAWVSNLDSEETARYIVDYLTTGRGDINSISSFYF